MQKVIRVDLWQVQGYQININGDPAKREIRNLKIVAEDTAGFQDCLHSHCLEEKQDLKLDFGLVTVD